MNEVVSNEVYVSFSDYLEKTRPNKETEFLEEDDRQSAGSKMAQESIALLKKLVADIRITCR